MSQSVFMDFPFSGLNVQTHHSFIVKNKPKRVQVLTHSYFMSNKTNLRKHFMSSVCQMNKKVQVFIIVHHKK